MAPRSIGQYIARTYVDVMAFRFPFALCASLLMLGSARHDIVRVPQSDIDAVNARYAAFGLTLPRGGIVLPEPFEPPFSNRSFVVPLHWITDWKAAVGRTPPTTVVASAMRADLPTLRLLMKKTYAGWQTAAARGWSWDSWFAAWDARLAPHGDDPLSITDALDPWNALEDFQSDNHSHPILPGYVSYSLSARLEAAPQGPCDTLHLVSGADFPLATHDAGAQPHAALLWDGGRSSNAWYVAFPDRHGAAASIECAGHTIPLTMTAQPRTTEDQPQYRDLGEGIAYIRVPSLFTYKSDEDLDRAVDAAKGVGSERVVLIDLRGNRGGAAPLGMLSHWFTAAVRQNARFIGKRYGSQSCFTTSIGFNLGQFLADGLQAPLSGDQKTQLQAELDAIGDRAQDACDVNPVVVSSSVTLRDHAFNIRRSNLRQTRVIAIVDRYCGSDCEGLTMTLALMPDAVIAGTNTSGTIGFVEPGFFALPHTRLPFEIATARDDNYGDGRSEASYGIAVDVLLPTAGSQSIMSLRALAQFLSH